jgi:GT2 family glycosyltransferase
MTLADSISIGITTKDRWADLEFTLEYLRKQELDGLETVVIDDGSTTRMPERFPEMFPWVRFIRSESSLGLIAQRNHLVRALTKPLYFSLDDDSFPVAGPLEEAAAWLLERPQVVALGFQIISRSSAIPTGEEDSTPFPVRHFIGCAFLLKRDIFLALGGFEVLLEQYGEEPEFCLRAFQQGLKTWFFPSVKVRHMVSQTGRSHARQCYFVSRTETLAPLWYFPRLSSYLRVCRFLPIYLMRSNASRKYALSCVKGVLSAVSLYLRKKTNKQRLTQTQYNEWKKQRLPNDPR